MYLETNENEHTTSKNLWETMKPLLGRKFKSIQTYLRREKSQIINLTLHLQELDEQPETMLSTSRRKGIIKIRADLNDKEIKRIIQRINKFRSWFCEKINKIDKPLTRLIKKNRERTLINKLRNERGEIMTDTAETQRIVRNYYKQIYVKELNNLDEMEKNLETYNLSKLGQEETKSLNRLITTSKIESVIKKKKKKKTPGTQKP